MENLNIVAKNFELTQDMKTYIDKRLSKIKKFSKHIIKTNLIFEEQRGRFRGEFLVEVAKKGLLKAQAEDSDFYTVIDQLKDKMEVQLKKYEDKLKGR